MNKNELKKGEIYTHSNGNIVRYDYLTHKVCGVHIGEFQNEFVSNMQTHDGSFTITQLREATPEEKHWLQYCISADKFVSKEEAMKTFISEYVECIKVDSELTLNTIYKVKSSKKWIAPDINGCDIVIYVEPTSIDGPFYLSHFKPSTKEAYDAQFVVKVKPFEILSFFDTKTKLVLQLQKNKRYKNIENNIEISIRIICLSTIYCNRYQIQSVINEEGNIFMIGDMITPTIVGSSNKGKSFKITGFRLNNDNTMVCAITDTHKPYGIGIDKIEHYIEKELSPIQLANIQHPELAIKKQNKNK
jgi:hypothetical protein